jgi:hypothetical protein
MDQRGRRARLTIASVSFLTSFVLVGITLVLHSLFTGKSQSTAAWEPAIQSISAFTLVLVTGIYVFLTRKLVQVQSDFLTPERIKAAIELGVVLADGTIMLRVASSQYPFTDHSDPDPLPATRQLNDIQQLQYMLFRSVVALPAALLHECRMASTACASAYAAQAALYESLRAASNHASSSVNGYGDAPRWGWADAEREHAELVSIGSLPNQTWEDLRSGKYVLDALSAVTELYEHIFEVVSKFG